MPEADNRITNKELVDLFGVNMPLKAVELLINNPNKLSTDALRAKLTEIAKGHTKAAPPPDLGKEGGWVPVNKLPEYANVHGRLWWDANGKMGTQGYEAPTATVTHYWFPVLDTDGNPKED